MGSFVSVRLEFLKKCTSSLSRTPFSEGSPEENNVGDDARRSLVSAVCDVEKVVISAEGLDVEAEMVGGVSGVGGLE